MTDPGLGPASTPWGSAASSRPSKEFQPPQEGLPPQESLTRQESCRSFPISFEESTGGNTSSSTTARTNQRIHPCLTLGDPSSGQFFPASCPHANADGFCDRILLPMPGTVGANLQEADMPHGDANAFGEHADEDLADDPEGPTDDGQLVEGTGPAVDDMSGPEQPPNQSTPRTRSQLNLKDWRFSGSTLCGPSHAMMAWANKSEEEPSTVAEALQSKHKDKWKAAMQLELKTLQEQGTWHLVERPAGRTVVSNKWVFKIKRNTDGAIDRFKARLVARGFTQRHGLDYGETFSPVVRGDTVRTLFAVIQLRRLTMSQVDVTGAYLYGDLDDDIYMEEPEGFESASDGSVVCKLRKSIYGLKQSARQWNKKFTDVLHTVGLKQTKSDSCLFTNDCHSLFFALYVDDGLIASTDKSAINSLIHKLSSCFTVTVGDAKTFIGLQVERESSNHLLIHQESYIKRLLHQFAMTDCKPVSTPMDASSKLSVVDDEHVKDGNSFPYRQLVGSLMYLSVCTRPDISYAVSMLAQFFDRATEKHWGAAKRVLRYLSGTAKLGIRFGGRNSGGHLYGFSDADLGGCPETVKSRSGVVFMLNNGPITWMSKKQTTVATSTCNSEFIAAFEATKQAVWLRRLVADFGLAPKGPTPISVDNQSAIFLIKNPHSSHKNSKHFEIAHAYSQEQYAKKVISVHYVESDEQIADILTKPLVPVRFRCNLQLLNMIE